MAKSGFIGNFIQFNVDTNEVEMCRLFKQGTELFQAMHRDIYFLGNVLDRKYRLLHLAYNLFLIGFI